MVNPLISVVVNSACLHVCGMFSCLSSGCWDTTTNCVAMVPLL